MKYIKNGKYILPDGILENVVLAYDGKICGFTTEDEIPTSAEVIDANGGYVAPGLVDIHIHGYLGEDTSDGKADGIFAMANGIMKNGVTSWCPTTMTIAKEEILKVWEEFKGDPQDLELPLAPKQFLHYFTEDNMPQTKLTRDLEKGMAVSIGRLREDSQYDYKFVCVSHNTLRGAAGGAVLLAELLCAKGYMD